MGTKQYFIRLTIIIFIGFMLSILISYVSMKSSFSSQVLDNTLPITAEAIHSNLKNDIVRPIAISKIMSEDNFIHEWVESGEKNKELIKKYLQSILGHEGVFTSFFISEKTRRYYHPNDEKRFISEDNPENIWYFTAKESKRDYEVVISEDEMNKNDITFFINYKVFNEEKQFLGIAGVGIKLSSLKSILKEYNKKYNKEIYILNKSGDVLFSNNTHKLDSIKQLSYLRSVWEKIIVSSSYTSEYNSLFSENILFHSIYLEEFDWYLIIEDRKSLNQSNIDSILLFNIVTIVILFLITLVMSKKIYDTHHKQLKELATLDSATKALNRGSLNEILKQKISYNERYPDKAVSFIIFDIDNFKQINDTYGHLEGDKIIKYIVDTISSYKRASDSVSRWGGEEFVLVLDDCDLDHALKIGEKIRSHVEHKKHPLSEKKYNLTISSGVSKLKQGDTIATLLSRADAALYLAKNSGKNKVCSELEVEIS